MQVIQALIEQYQLMPHPEGGYFKETYRSPHLVKSPVNGAARAGVTQIYFLLGRGDVSRLHKVLHEEIWHFYQGAPLRLIDMDGNNSQEIMLGEAGNYHHVIPAGNYQAAESTGDYSLVGCTVAPGFDFADFSFLKDDLEQGAAQPQHLDQYQRFI